MSPRCPYLQVAFSERPLRVRGEPNDTKCSQRGESNARYGSCSSTPIVGRARHSAWGILFVGTVARGYSCEEALARLQPLDGWQRRAIAQAVDTHPITVLRATINGKERVVVLLGEVHIQGREPAANGRAMIDAFPNRALEQYPGGLAWKALLRFAYFMEGLFSWRNQGSNITYARRHANIAGRVDSIVRRYRLDEMTPVQLEAFRYHHGGAEYSGTELIRMRDIAPLVANWNLEQGFRPNGREQAAAWGIPATMLSPWLSTLPALQTFRSLGDVQIETAMAWGGAALATYVGARIARDLALPEMGQTLIPRRDLAMAGNIQRHFEQNDGRDVLLVVVGKNHLYGIETNLRSLGFTTTFSRRPPERGVLD